MPKTIVKSNTLKKNFAKKSGFQFRWWMAIALVGIVAVVGILVYRASHAFGGGKIYIEQEGSGPYVEYDFNFDGTVNLKESISGGERRNVPLTQARAVGLEMVQEAYRKTGQTEIANSINPGNLPAQVAGQIDAADQKSKSNPMAQNPSTNQTAPTTGQQAAPSATPPASQAPATSSGGTTTSGVPAPVPTTYPVSGKVELQVSSSIAQSAKSVTYRVDGEQVAVTKKSPFTFELDSNKYENGTHLLQAEVHQIDNFTRTYVYALNVQNPTDWWSQFTQRFITVFGG